jgi:type IV pilus assembly protein PilQ
MRMYPSRIICHAMALSVLLMFSAGCVKRMSAVNEPNQTAASGLAILRSVTVSADASRVELASDKPFTYTSYKAGQPAKIIVDISQAEPGLISTPIEVNRGEIRRIELVRQPVGGGVLTRMEISLLKDVDFTVATDPADKTKLLVTLLPAEAEAKPLRSEAKETPLTEARIEEKSIAPEVPAAAAREAAQPPSELKPEKALTQPVEAQPAPLLEPSVPVIEPVVAAARPAEPLAAVPQKNEAPRRLTGVTTAADGVELSIEGGVQTFNSFKLTKPDRIVLDLFGMKSTLKQNVVPIGALGIANARVGSTPDKVRVVLDAAQETLPPFEVVKSDLGLKIRFKTLATERPASAAARPAPAPVVPAPVAAAPAAPPPARAVPAVPPPAAVRVEVPPAPHVKGSLETLDFKIVDGVSRITMKLYGSCEPGKPVRGVQGLSLTIKDCQVPKRLQRALDTSQFGSPVLSVTPYQVKVKGSHQAKLLVRLRGNPSFTVSREGDLLVWDITNPGPLPVPRLPAAAARSKEAPGPSVAEELIPAQRPEEAMTEILPVHRTSKKAYTGRRVTLEFSDADVRKIFQLIAEVSGLNFLIADDVTGTITIKLVNVPWDQALDVILDARGLGMQRDGNIVQIKPKAKIQSQADEELAAKKAVERGMELRTAVFEVNYASVSDVAGQFAAMKSERGTITKDDRTSRVIVKDIQTALDDMRALLKTLDAPEKQVMIEARIVEASSNFTRDLGVQWGLHFRDGSASVLGINNLDTNFGGVVSPAGPGAASAWGCRSAS